MTKPYLILFFAFAACAHSESKPASTANGEAQAAASKEPKAVREIRKRAAFDLGCDAAAVQVTQLQEGSFTQVASYGASCGDKRATYMERMGTIIKN